MSLENIQGKLSRREMRNIMAGSCSGIGYGNCSQSTNGSVNLCVNGACQNYPQQ